MKTNSRSLICTAALLFGALSQYAICQGPIPAPRGQDRPRVIVLTDIGNEPDDSMSMVRFLLYSNDYDVEGLIATTSNWLKDKVNPQLIEERVQAYGQVLPNLRAQAEGYPDMKALQSVIRSGPAEYGMLAVGKGKNTDASRLIIQSVDKPDPRPVWVVIWGGANVLAQALWSVEHTRSAAAVDKFVSKLRVYSISDQDDAGPWARAEFPKLWWIASIHAFNEYGLATWTGINMPIPTPDSDMSRQAWLDANVRKGPLGSLYPKILYGMEGDTPSFLNLIPNGLGFADHPDWGGWGGRYGKLSDALGLWTDTRDTIRTSDDTSVTSNQATIWRWRKAYQNDLAGRIKWSISPTFREANHNPELILNGISGRAPVFINACAGENVHLSAAGSSDPDGDHLTYHWWHYRKRGKFPS